MKSGLLAGGAATIGPVLLANATAAQGQDHHHLDEGDAAILRFLAAAELIEADLWTQYAELGGIGSNQPIEIDPTQELNLYQIALSNLDPDGPQYIASNTLDEVSHKNFLNAYLESKGAEPVDLDEFRHLPGSSAKGSTGIGRLTNLMELRPLPQCDQSGPRRNLPSGHHSQWRYCHSQNGCRFRRSRSHI
jgi:hypothetical protein